MLLGGNGRVVWSEKTVPSGIVALLVASGAALDGSSSIGFAQAAYGRRGGSVSVSCWALSASRFWLIHVR
mgnify:CR=1 FL=1